MSDTPRTDAILISESGGLWDGKRIDAFIAFARNLECMLAEAVGALEELDELVDDEVDISNTGGPNTAMKVQLLARAALARIKAAKEQM